MSLLRGWWCGGCCFFFFNDTATTEIYTLSLHDALPIYCNLLATRPSPDVPCITFLGDNERIVDVQRIHDRMARWPNGTLHVMENAEHEVIMEDEATRTWLFDTMRSEEHTSELQSPDHLVCRLLLEKKKKTHTPHPPPPPPTPPHPPPHTPPSLPYPLL